MTTYEFDKRAGFMAAALAGSKANSDEDTAQILRASGGAATCATVSLCKETLPVRKETGLNNAKCNCLTHTATNA